MTASAAWLAAAATADPIGVFRLPDLNIYFASHGAHYPVTGEGEPHHAGIIDKGGLPVITKSIQSIFDGGRATTSFGALWVRPDSTWDGLFSDHTSNLRGARIQGWITFPALDWSDAFFYLDARIEGVEMTERKSLKLTLRERSWEELLAEIIPAGTSSTTLGGEVKAHLLAAGLSWPADFDTAAWTAWTAPGKPGSFIINGGYSEGDVFSVISHLMRESMSWYTFRRSGLFYIEQWSDPVGTPPVDLDLTGFADLFTGGKWASHGPLFQEQKVIWDNAGTPTPETAAVDPASAGADWLLTAQKGKEKKLGLTAQGDAQTLAAQRLLLLSSERIFATVIADNRPLAYELGDVVKLNYQAKGLHDVGPLYSRIIGFKEDPNKGTTTLTLSTKLGGPALL